MIEPEDASPGIEWKKETMDNGISRNAMIISILMILATVGLLTYVAYRGFNEAAGNRHKTEKIYQMCLADHQPVLSCKVAIKGS